MFVIIRVSVIHSMASPEARAIQFKTPSSRLRLVVLYNLGYDPLHPPGGVGAVRCSFFSLLEFLLLVLQF